MLIKFLTAAFTVLLIALSSLLVNCTTSKTFREKNPILSKIIVILYAGTFILSFPIGYGYVLIKYLKNKKNEKEKL